MSSEIRIIGVDPGLSNTGYAILDFFDPGWEAIEGGVIRTKSSDPMEVRLAIIYDHIVQIIEEFSPVEMAIEDLHSRVKFARTAILMGHARGVVVMAAGRSKLAVTDYQPTKAKNLVTGSGRATKEQVKNAVSMHLDDKQAAKNEHVADAFSIALCHAMVRNVVK